MKSFKKFNNVLKGLAIGASNIVPGVSGGTTAVLLGIYEKLINSIAGLKTDFKENFKFLLQIGIGAVIGVFALSGVMSYLLAEYPIAVNYLFIGFVVGSIKLIIGKMETQKFSITNGAAFLLGLLVVVGISFVGEQIGSSGSTGELSYISLLFAGFVTAVTMILPGISGSLTLVMLGLYDSFVAAIATFNIPFLIAGAVGGLIGLLSTVKIISYLIKNYKDTTYSAILGLVVGSILSIIVSNPVGSSYVTALASVFVGVLATKLMLSKA